MYLLAQLLASTTEPATRSTSAFDLTWLSDLFFKGAGPAHSIIAIAFVSVLGLLFGSIKYRGIGFGISGVLFAGLVVGNTYHFNGHEYRVAVDSGILDFVREFGLILFVYSIGMQVGPSFFGSLRKSGLPLNMLAATVVLLGTILGISVYKFYMQPGEVPAAVGVLSGAVTNTPSLAAAQQALREKPNIPADALTLPGQAYAITYPFGIVGGIIAMLVVRFVYRVNVEKELEEFYHASASQNPSLHTLNLEVRNPSLAGRRLSEVPLLSEHGVVVSRLLRSGRPEVASPDSVLDLGNVLLAVGPKDHLEKVKLIVGSEAAVDLRTVPSEISTDRLIVTKNTAVGKRIEDLELRERFGVNVTRVSRTSLELPVTPGLRFQFGDHITVVGDKSALKKVAEEVGNSAKQLAFPHVLPIFVGIVLGVIFGSIPIFLPGVPAPVKLGLAGGPMLVAIFLARINKIGPIHWYIPTSANLLLRELGIVLFIAAVGLRAGETFVQTARDHGFEWFFLGAIITLLPRIIVGLFARGVMKLNYLTICGMLAGSSTDPPALSFAISVTGSEAPNVGYATVYPLVMLMRIVAAQLFVIFLAG